MGVCSGSCHVQLAASSGVVRIVFDSVLNIILYRLSILRARIKNIPILRVATVASSSGIYSSSRYISTWKLKVDFERP
jgi:hypothetical protein